MLLVQSLFAIGQTDLPYATQRQHEVSRQIQQRISRMRHEFPDLYRDEYFEIYVEQFLALKKMLEQDMFLFDDTLDLYINVITHNLNAVLDTPMTDVLIVVDKNIRPNAFALNNRIILVHYGLFRFLQNKDQLAFILAHELAHEYLEHADMKLDSMLAHQKEMNIAMRQLNSSINERKAIGAARLRPILYERQQFSRDLEYSADSLALLIMRKSGYRVEQSRAILSEIETYYTADTAFMNDLRFFFDGADFSIDSLLKAPFSISMVADPFIGKYFSKDSLDSHPSFAVRAQLIEQQPGFETVNLDSDSSNDLILLAKQIEASEFSMKTLLESGFLLPGLFESLKILAHHKPNDTLHIRYTAKYLYELDKQKRAIIHKSHMLQPNAAYPYDFNALIHLYNNLSDDNFTTLCLNFHDKYRNHLEAIIYEKHTRHFKNELKPPLTYKEWRQLKAEKRKNKD